MQFNSVKYLIYLGIVYLVFNLVSERMRWCVLLFASLLFYAELNAPYLLVVLILVAFITYGFGIWLDQVETEKARKNILWIGIASNLVILIVMKYQTLVVESIIQLITFNSIKYQIQPIKTLVTIGISYYVFQAISYLIDVYLEIEKPERHIGYFVLYLSFFPKLLQGPIERSSELLPQLREKYKFDYNNTRYGMLLFAWGLFKKIVIADRVGIYVDTVYNNITYFSGTPLLYATYLYAIQIYMDFSGYTDMALGSAYLFNIKLTQNFNSPYFATSVADFWRRWHISFSRWILDYIFKPLQMKWRYLNKFGTASALIVTFLISGIWHGASAGFIIWGVLHGIFLASSVYYKPFQKKIHKALGLERTNTLKYWQMFATFNFICFAWIFFRSNTTSDALYLITHVADNSKGLGELLSAQGSTELILTFVFVAAAIIVESIGSISTVAEKIYEKPIWVRWTVYYTLMIIIILFHVETGKSFAYFQF
ncbi:MAG: hypothetical protein GJT30_03745 [Geobacter sp.]|nr:hypothetical protein [Geobacter sp.]